MKYLADSVRKFGGKKFAGFSKKRKNLKVKFSAMHVFAVSLRNGRPNPTKKCLSYLSVFKMGGGG